MTEVRIERSGGMWHVEVPTGALTSVSWATFTRRGAEWSARRFLRRRQRDREQSYTLTID